MKFSPLLAILAAGGLIGWFSPDVAEAPCPTTQVAAAEAVEARSWSRDRTQALRTDAWSGGELMLERASDGHFYADVSVDSVSSRMLVDTGASVVALREADADTLGVIWDAEDLAPVAQGAGGTVYGVPVMLDHVQLGELEASGVQAVVVPSLRVSLLGQSFLGQVGRIEVAGEHMVLGG